LKVAGKQRRSKYTATGKLRLTPEERSEIMIEAWRQRRIVAKKAERDALRLKQERAAKRVGNSTRKSAKTVQRTRRDASRYQASA
jgi:hypothetical protein